ncbi:FtsX-like permease family protein [Zhouia sp. PK063]|uniref:FtsX-like permease family protein n=1 Tax=Zhouia sp. PK063 TaxID=3373602 RepID=UPI0037A34C3F
MIWNFFKIAWRNIWKNKLFTFINVISLAIGLSASFVIGLMVYYDFTFDTFHKDADRIYRVTTKYSSPEGLGYNHGVALPLTKASKEGITGVSQVAVFYTADPTTVTNKTFLKPLKNPQGVMYADADYLSLMNYQWLAGNPATALDGPNKVVLTESRAKAYFPNKAYDDILGQTLVYDDSIATAITGIVANFKGRTDFTFGEMISLETAKQSYMKDQLADTNWNSTSSNIQLFIKLHDKTALAGVQQQFDAMAKDHESADAAKHDQHRTFYLQPLKDLHFNTNYGIFDSSEHVGNKSVLVSLLLIALFILALGCINFINLNTAQASQRSKEIGIRKTLGSSKQQLVYQFLGETFLLTVLATLLSLGLTAVLLNVFAGFIPEGIHFKLLVSPPVIAGGLLFIVMVALLSGFYPSLYLSGFQPISILKNKNFSGQGNLSLRKGLIVFQFVIAQVFIIATLMVGKQIHFLMQKDMGFTTDAIAYARLPWNAPMAKAKLLAQQLKTIPQLEAVSLGGSPPASFNWHSTEVDFTDGNKNIHTNLQLLFGDKKYMDLYRLKLLAGRQLRNDSIPEYIINDTYRKQLGFKTPDEAIGHMIGQGKDAVPIVGVMADFNQRSLKSAIGPMAFRGDWNATYSRFNTIHFKLNNSSGGGWTTILENVRKDWSAIYPESDINIQFMDETIAKFYANESKMQTLLNWATSLAVLISCLGLLGLVIYTTERRVKEIGIRKILGASLLQLNLLLCRDFVVLILVAFAVAAPLAWYGLHQWLQEYAYRLGISSWIFALSCLGIVVLALLIMGIKTLTVANQNPVKSLRTE